VVARGGLDGAGGGALVVAVGGGHGGRRCPYCWCVSLDLVQLYNCESPFVKFVDSVLHMYATI
jgi:hypothetical protein